MITSTTTKLLKQFASFTQFDIHENQKTEGGERHFIVGCFDNSGYNGFVNHGRIEKTTADENSNHCAGLFDRSTGSGNDGTGSGTTDLKL